MRHPTWINVFLVAVAMGCSPARHTTTPSTGTTVTQPNVEVQVDVNEAAWDETQDRWRLAVTVSFTNHGDATFELDKATACEGGELRNNVFEVLVDGAELPYLGIMAKRAHPGPDGFFRIAAGATHRVAVDLGTAYALPRHGGRLSLRFDHYNHFSRDAVQLTSDVVAQRL